MAETLGKRLLGEVDEVGLDELLHTLRQVHSSHSKFFGLQHLDRLLEIASESRASLKTNATETPPCIELTSLHPGGGSAHLLYYLVSLATTVPTSGTVVVIDMDGSFSIPRLAQVLSSTLAAGQQKQSSDMQEADMLSALKHVHIFRPQSLASTVATVRDLADYLFHGEHHSLDRAVAFIALHSASTFLWQQKAADEDAALPSSPSSRLSGEQSSFGQLASALKDASQAFCCPTVVTSWHLGAVPTSIHGSDVHSLRPSLPMPLSGLPVLRLVLRRKPVQKYPAGISVEQASREAGNRLAAVEEGRFEAYVNDWSMDERMLQKMQRIGAGFSFGIKESGVDMDDIK